jgi:BlaI family transcriptional regulator, penicillinase repressor
MNPTNPELDILKLLWQRQPLTAKDIHNSLAAKHEWSYSSTRKTLERMGDKGLVHITTEGNKNLYATQVNKLATLAKFAQDFANRVLELDGPLPVSMFSGSQLLDSEEIEDLEQLLKELSSNNDSEQQL